MLSTLGMTPRERILAEALNDALRHLRDDLAAEIEQSAERELRREEWLRRREAVSAA